LLGIFLRCRVLPRRPAHTIHSPLKHVSQSLHQYC
jgi:hypothetical protein